MNASKFGEAGELVIRNIRMLEQAHAMASSMDDAICIQMENLFKDVLDESLWFTHLPSAEKGRCSDDASWISLNQWRADSGKPEDFHAWFTILDEDQEDEEEFYITQLCKQGMSRIGVSWGADYKALLRKDVKQLWTKWKRFSEVQNKAHPRLEELGFNYKDGAWFMPMQVDIEELAASFKDDSVSAVLLPEIERVVRAVEISIPEFDAIIEAAKKE